MCGIAGFVLRDAKAQAAAVKAMCDRIRHRGPDDEGFYVEGGCALGMRRLSIIDLNTGHQPISNEDGSVWVVFNGEIYNFQDLRRDLAARGHTFSTNTDTETLVHLFEDKGVEAVAPLRGMFAFAIWDTRARRLFAARDRFGKKPLYYAALPSGLYFGSEIKCLRAAGVPLEIDEEALRLYFQFNYIPDPFSAFRSIRKLPPGCWLTYDENGALEVRRYWRPPATTPEPTPGISPAQVRTRLLNVFDEAVRMRMIADVPLGAFLSGGIDSSAVVASMALQSREPVKTFSIGFEEAHFNELHWASAVARKYKTKHHEIVVRPNSIELVERLVRHFDEPFADMSAIPTLIVSEFAAGHVKVALSGDGGDELFAGYPRFADVGKLRKLDRIPLAVRRMLSTFATRMPYSAYGKNYLRMISRESGLARYFDGTFSPHFMRERLLQPKWMLPADTAYLKSMFADALLPGEPDILSQVMQFEAAVNLPGDMLVKVDRMSMAVSLEVRCPLLDQEVADVAALVPHSWNIRNGKGKQFLLQTMADRLPPELLDRPKMGFGIPLEDWFRGELRAFLWDHLTSTRFLERGIVSREFLLHVLKEHDTRRRNNVYWLWALLMLELWYRDVETALAGSEAHAGRT